MYLLHHCKGITKDAIVHCVLSPEEECGTKAISILHKQCRRPYDITEALLTLLHGPSLHQDDVAGLQRLIKPMINCKISLSQMERGSDLKCFINIK
ncbi:hypothetical protein Smp_164700 [Schistosoma mansoni]|uniref:CASPASE_P20 domain-containing protein n=1 Tax=Schistosoma mansoni TaxID=6183 RepID=G4LV33_SCHMA|nr:hypothetical protein Smp_164700 [Schistosoma mansoni]|eukprot:XP_018645135.1 hypothetical protein Smp_164700 [Schistosoma mansoni]